MILVRTTFQVKFGQMDAVMAILKEAVDSGFSSDVTARVLTDASGQMFTLVFEAEAESIDAHMDALQASYSDPEASGYMGRMMQHIEWGRRDFYNIEWEA